METRNHLKSRFCEGDLMNTHHHFFRSAVRFSLFLTQLVIQNSLLAQFGLRLPDGTFVAQSFGVGHVNVRVTTREIKIHYIHEKDDVWRAPAGREIIHVDVKPTPYSNDHYHLLLVLLDDGSVYKIETHNVTTVGHLLDGDAVSMGRISVDGGSYGQFNFDRVTGDAMYAHTLTGQVVVSRDTARTWQMDSAGLNGKLIQSIDLDTAQYVYGGSWQNGLFKQHPDSSVWHRIDTLSYIDPYYHTRSYPTIDQIFVDRLNRVWVDLYGGGNMPQGIYVSTDNGRTWSHDTTGIGTTNALSFGDDSFGNIYAITKYYGPYSIYRSSDVGHSWTRIDQSLTAMNVNQSLNTAPFTSVRGDSIIFVATPFGVFQTSDQGTTWAEANEDLPAENVYSMLRTPTGHVLVTTDLGIFRLNPNDTIWTREFPAIGYFGGRPLYQDGVGNVYTLGNFILPSYQYFVYRSTDNGATWNPDTAGVKQSTSDGAFYIDETGTQHSVTASGSPYVANIAAKPLNASWQPDTSGFTPFTTAQYGYAFVSDGAGFLYLAGRFNGGNVWRRPIAGGTWTPDTAGLSGKTVHSFTRSRNGDVFAIAYGLTGSAQSPLLHRTGGVWSQINPPLAGASPLAISVDSTNAIFCAFGSGTFTFVSNGVYFSTDTGKTWTYAGLKGMTINSLVSYGDTTYALTQGNGTYLLRHQRAAAVAQNELRPSTYSLFQNYPNPFNPTTTISFSTPERGRLSLKVFDILGREVATLANGQMEAGVHQVSFDASKLSSGVYFYRLTAGSFVSTKKLVLLK